jgi:hypothetical protein
MSGSLSPASTSSSRRSSFTMGQRSRGSSSDLRCPPIPGASPPTSAATPKVTRRVPGSSYNSNYKPTFASNASRAPATTTKPKIPNISRTQAASILDESNSDKKEEEQCQSTFSSAEHSVLGTVCFFLSSSRLNCCLSFSPPNLLMKSVRLGLSQFE